MLVRVSFFRLSDALNESATHNRSSQVHGRVIQIVYDINREGVTLISGSERTSGKYSCKLTFIPRIIGPGNVPSARVAL